MSTAIKLLLDANISPETAQHVRSLGFQVRSLIEDGLGGITDEEVARLAEKGGLAVITFDLDFGEMYYFAKQKKFGVVVLRLEDQRIEKVNAVLAAFLTNHPRLLTKKPLIILTESDLRISH